MFRRGHDAISPTALYTGHVWSRNSLSHDELASRRGRILFDAVAPWMAVSRALGGPTLESFLLARHRAIDDLLTQAIDAGSVGAVIEVACGLSPRGWRFARRYGDRLTYIEADLPAMAARKRQSLERMDVLSAHHRVVAVDALRDHGQDSLAAAAATLDPEQGLAIITEGLLSYLTREDVLAIWGRFAGVLRGFPSGLYLSDLHLGADSGGAQADVFKALLSVFVRGPVSVHFAAADDAIQALADAGFPRATVTRASEHASAAGDRSASRISIVEAAMP